jgi:hypothetical protein
MEKEGQKGTGNGGTSAMQSGPRDERRMEEGGFASGSELTKHSGVLGQRTPVAQRNVSLSRREDQHTGTSAQRNGPPSHPGEDEPRKGNSITQLELESRVSSDQRNVSLSRSPGESRRKEKGSELLGNYLTQHSGVLGQKIPVAQRNVSLSQLADNHTGAGWNLLAQRKGPLSEPSTASQLELGSRASMSLTTQHNVALSHLDTSRQPTSNTSRTVRISRGIRVREGID